MSDRYPSTSDSDGSGLPKSFQLEKSGDSWAVSSGQGINITIQNLQNEQERVQKKTFTNWMNTYLCQRIPPIKVENLFEEVKDGIVLLSLLEVLSGEKLKIEKGVKLSKSYQSKPHHVANISAALKFLEKKKIKLVNINPSSIAEGKPSIVLGLVWTIILYFQIEETFNVVPPNEQSSQKQPSLPRQSLLGWADNLLSKKYGLQVKDFGKSWTDGVAFNAMIHNIRPDLVDMDVVRRQEAPVNLENAFSTAESHLGIPRLLDPEDVNVEKPDEKSIMTYVAQFVKAFPDGGPSEAPSTNIDTAHKETQAYTNLMNWLNGEAKEILDSSLQPVTDRESEFMHYFGFKTELEKRKPLYLKLGEKVLSGQSMILTQPEWQKLDVCWLQVEEQMNQWLKKLDACLPRKLGTLGQWLYDAEKLLGQKEEQTDNADDMAALYAELAREHRDFFKDLEEWKRFFAQIRHTGHYEGMMLQGPQFDHISARLESVTVNSTARLNRLEYTYIRFKLLADLTVAETKLKQWTSKYGSQEHLEHMLKDTNYHQEIFECIDRTFNETRKCAEKYKLKGADLMEASQIDKFLVDVSERWTQMSLKIQNVKHLLEETSVAWKNYSTYLDVLDVWLATGEQVMKQSLEARQEFFKDLADYEEKLKVFNEAASFLINVLKEEVATEIGQKCTILNRRFTELVEGFHSYCQHMIIDRTRMDYEKGVLNLKDWLSSSAALLNHNVRCTHVDLKDHLLKLDKCSAEIQEAENNFKMTTKKAQSLVKDSSQEDVTAMLNTLNAQKEILLRLKKEVPERIKYLKVLLPNVESLETGILDLEKWLLDGETLLQSHELGDSPEETDKRIEKHKAFFTETTYQKSILESKNKVSQKINTTKMKLKNVDFKPADDLMTSANFRFQNVIGKAKEWESKLENLARMWRSLHQKQLKLEEWLDRAQNLLDESKDDPENLIQKHKMFFERIDHHLMSDYESVANDILQQVSTSECRLLRQTLDHLKERWEHVLHHAPIKLFKLEFVIPENKFEYLMEKAEIALQQEREQIRSNRNVKNALLQHKQMFEEGNLIPTCEQWLCLMKNLAEQLLKLSKIEQSLDQRYRNHQERWNKLRMIADDIFLQLKQLPDRWKAYNDKVTSLNVWVETAEKLLENMNKDGLTSEEYKQLLPKFLKEMQNVERYEADLNLLEKSLEDLMRDSPEADTKKEKEYLQGTQNKFCTMKSKLAAVQERSDILTKGYEFSDNLSRMSNWLGDAQKLASEYPRIDSLEDARAYLYEHETVLNKLEIEKTNIEAEIEAGKRLQRERNAPSIIQQSVEELNKTYEETNELVKMKHEKLKRHVKDWENYENDKATLLNCLKKTDSELDKSLEIYSQENAKKDMQSKKELQNTLNKLQDSLDLLTKLNKNLVEVASRERQSPLKGEVTDFDKRLENISQRLHAKLADLEAAVAKWSDYYMRLNSFCDWLNEKESKLNEIYENKQDSPETQLQKAEGIASQVFENRVTLENLEKDARGLTQNFRSRETTLLKSKLTSIRRQWESLCTLAKDRSSTLSGNVAHWQKYQTLRDQLLPWVLKAEKYCETELPKCVSLEEAKDLYDLHQAFMQECEENLPIFDQLNTEADYLVDQPNIQHDLEAFQKRWGNILTNSEDRSHKVERRFESWSACENELKKFSEVIDRLCSRLSSQPDVNTFDIQNLEHELALIKALHEDVHSQEPQLALLIKQIEQVQDHASSEGLKMLKLKQNSATNNWNDINTSVVERQKALYSSLQCRRTFLKDVENIELWVQNMQGKLDSGSEIYSDEVADIQIKLKSLEHEAKAKEKNFHDLQLEFQDLIAILNNEEAILLKERFDRLMQDNLQIELLIHSREELCDKWSSYSNAQKDIQGKIKVFQSQLQSPEVKEEQTSKIIYEVENIRKVLQSWVQDSSKLDNLMLTARVVLKDRATQRMLHFSSELSILEKLLDAVATSAKQKKVQLSELVQLSNKFIQEKDDLVSRLSDVQEKVLAIKVVKSNLQGLRNADSQIEELHDNISSLNPEYEHLRELGRQIMSNDPTKATAVQQQLGQMNSDWESVQTLLSERQELYKTVINMWEQYSDGKQKVLAIVADLEPIIHSKLTFTNQEEVKKYLDQHRNAEFNLRANQAYLDEMNNRGVKLLEDLKNIPSFDRSSVEYDLDDMNLKWEKANGIIEERRESLEAQLICWDQVQSGVEEVCSWVNAMVTKLDGSLKHFDDVVSVESRLTKYKDEAPHYEALMTEVNEKLGDLKELNGNQPVPSLASAQKNIQGQFEKAASLGNELESMISSFYAELEHLQKAMQGETEWINHMKETLSECDDVTGTTYDLIERYEICKQQQQELVSHQKEISAVQAKTSLLNRKYPSSKTANLVKDLDIVCQKCESLIHRSDRVEKNLKTQIEQYCNEAQQQQLRWLSSAKEKVYWCNENTGDRYMVETKLSTIKDLENNLLDLELKKQEAVSRLHASKQVLPRSRQEELESAQKNLDKDWENMKKSVQQTQLKLGNSMKQWQQHDQQFEMLSQWLQNVEAKMKLEITLKPDLGTKMKQLENLKAHYQAVQSQEAEFQSLRDTAQQISGNGDDNRMILYTGQLLSRYQILLSAIKEQVDRCEQNVNEHDQYLIKKNAALKWLSMVRQDLDQCSSLVGDEESLITKLAIVKGLMTSKEEGSALLNSALEAGEKLYPSTSNEGRESIRHELRNLRDAWEEFSDSLNDTQRQLDSSRMQWLSFDENFEQLNKWLMDVEKDMDDSGLKSTFQEKKSWLQQCKTLHQEILSHQTMIDSINDKGTALSSSQILSKLKNLNNKYSHLASTAENQVKKAEDNVNDHQLYQDTYHHCQDWMNTARDKLASCSDVGGDKQAVQNRLDRLQELIENLQEGETSIKSANYHAERIIPHTSTQGQINLKKELHTLNSEFATLISEMNAAKERLQESIKAIERYDASWGILSNWLNEIEFKLKDCELKATLREKETQVEILKSIQQEMNAKQVHIIELQTLAAKVQSPDTRLTKQSTQLATRYETLKNLTRDNITKWEEYVKEHSVYLEKYSHCVDWINTLRNRLKMCGEIAEDKQDVEVHLLKLHELSAERDEGASHIHQVIESGENIYSSTSSEGRNTIRQDIRKLRDDFERLSDEISEMQRRLDINLNQWSSYNETFEVFQKWLEGTEIKMKKDVRLQATLPEKKAYLQNYKVLHQDILSREHIIDNLKEKAYVLTQASTSAKIFKSVDELKCKYEIICERSEVILDELEQSVHNHQQYQDIAQDLTDWLNSSRERFEACTDRSGDRLSLHERKDRLKEFKKDAKVGNNKLSLAKNMMVITAKDTSSEGQEVLKREIEHLQREWDDYLNLMKHTEASLDQTLVMWENFESGFKQLAEWITEMEKKIKSHELKDTLKEKQEELEKLKKQHHEILAHQSQMDRFTDEAQNLMHTSSDLRLGTQISQLTNKYQGLQSALLDLITRWEKYVQDHHLFNNRMQHFNKWISMANQTIQQCKQPHHGHESLEEKKALIQVLINEKDHGHLKLSSALESGEKLYPDTSFTGKEKLLVEFRMVKQKWQTFMSELNETHQHVDDCLQQWSSYVDEQKQILKWLTETQLVLRKDVDLKNTLQEKRQQLQAYRNILQEIVSNRRMIDSFAQRAQNVLQIMDSSEVSEVINNVTSHYEKLVVEAKNLIQRSEQLVTVHQNFQDSMQAALDWLNLMKQRQTLCADTSGEKQALQKKLDRLNELFLNVPEGASKIENCEILAQTTMDDTGMKGRQSILSQLDDLHNDWKDYETKLNSLKESLQHILHSWTVFESQHQNISSWLKFMEKEFKECQLKSTLEEKQELLMKYTELLCEITEKQAELFRFTEETYGLQQLSLESHIGSSISQLTTRYQTLLMSARDVISQCEKHVEDHKFYKNKLADCSLWLEEATRRFNQCSESGGSKAELEDRLNSVQDSLKNRDAGYAKLNQLIEAGERLYPGTATDGREIVRQELRKLKLGYESLFDNLSTIQRKLEMSLVQWTSFDESYGQMEHWLKQMQSELGGQTMLRATLEEKKSQLLHYKAMQQDVLSYRRVIDRFTDKANTLFQASKSPELEQFITKTNISYKQLCSAAQEHVSQYESFVKDHQHYTDLYSSCADWLNTAKEKLAVISNISGDISTIENRLNKIQDFDVIKKEGVSRISGVMELSEKVMLHTAPQGREILITEINILKADWEALILVITKTKSDLQICMDKWKNFQSIQDCCSSLLKKLESELRNIELKKTLQDKQAQLKTFKTLEAEVVNHQNDFDCLSVAAEDLVKVSSESQVFNQASQLITKYQKLSLMVKELCHKWEQFVLDNHKYIQAFDQCQKWICHMNEKIKHINDASGDRSGVEYKLKQVQELLHEKEEGMHLLQIALEKLQIVLPNTSVSGRDILHQDMQVLQQDIETLSSKLDSTKAYLEDMLTRQTMYSDMVQQLQRWLKELEDQLTADSSFQNTLQEKKLQLERVKLLQLNILSKQSTIDSLNEITHNLKQTTADENFGSQTCQIIDRYQKLIKKAKDLTEECEKNVGNHQIYRNAYLDTSDWLTSAVEKLGMCSDITGDRHTIEAALHRVEDISLTVENGRIKLQDTKNKGDIVIHETSVLGQNLIREELRLLSSDFDDYEADLNNIRCNLATLKDKWTAYEEFYDQLSHWMKDTENGLKVEGDLKTSLDQKATQLNSHKAAHDAIIMHQEAFDQLEEKTQLLKQHSVKGRVPTQLSQLNSRYAALISLSKDLLKRYEQVFEDHEQYSDAYCKARSLVQEASERLSVFAHTSGDRYDIQHQLEKLQLEFGEIREKSQMLLHAAMTWGEKTIVNTSAEGREIIRTEIKQLHADWDLIVSQLTETIVMLESCLLQWSDYSDSREQVLKWLKDMEKRLRDKHPLSNLSEKKAELQRIKGLYQDIVSYEHMVESVTCKAAELTEKSPTHHGAVDTSQIQARYSSVKEQAKDLLASSEENLAHHQDFHDGCQSFYSWLRTAIEKLIACSDVYGEKTVIEDKIERTKSLLSNLNEGNQRLSYATRAGEIALPSTSASGQTQIRQELQNINKDFEEYHVQLIKALSDLETCLNRWQEFVNSYQEFSNWLRELEVSLRSELSYKATLEEKQQHWNEYKILKEDVRSHQSSLIRLNEKADALLKINADAKTPHAVSQLATRYNAVAVLANDMALNLETYCNNHKQYHNNNSLFTDWLNTLKQRLSIVSEDKGSMEIMLIRITEVNEIQNTLEDGHTLLCKLLESCEKTLPNTNQKGVHFIRKEVDNAKAAYEDILVQVSMAKRSLEGAVASWEKFDHLYGEVADWMSNVEQKLSANQEFKADLPEKKSNFEKYKVMHADCLAHKLHLDKLEEKASQVNDITPKSKTAELRSKYNAILNSIMDGLKHAEEQVKSHEEYRKSYIECLDWLTNTKNRLQRLSSHTGDSNTLQDRLSQLKNYQRDLEQGQEMLTHMTALGKRLCNTTSYQGQDVVQKEMETLCDEWKLLSSAVKGVENKLKTDIAECEVLDNNMLEFNNWMGKVEQKLKKYLETNANLARKMAQLQEAEALYTEILSHKAELNSIRDRGDDITNRSNDMTVSNKIRQLSTRFQTVCSSSKNVLTKLKECVEDHTLYDETLDTAATWLKIMLDRVKDCNDNSGDWNAIKERIENIKDITASLDDGLHKVNCVCDQAEKILPDTSFEGKKLIEEQVTVLTNNWEKLNSDIDECTKILEDIQQNWAEYDQYYNSVSKWLADTETFLQDMPESCELLSEHKTQLDRFKMILFDIEDHEKHVTELASKLASLKLLCESLGVADSLKEIQDRYNSVINRAKEIVDHLQTCYDKHLLFSEEEQKCEKWLHDMSSRLASLSRFNTSTMEHINAQIENHKLIMKEMEDYRPTINVVSQLGQDLINSDPCQSHLSTKVQFQLASLEERYQDIQTTAHQMRDTLAEILIKRQDYQKHLDSTSMYLTHEFPKWVTTVEKDIPKTQKEAQKQKDLTQAELEKLNFMKQELLSAAHQCENICHPDQNTKYEQNMESSESEFADQVSIELTSCTNQAGKHLAHLEEIINKWDSVDRMRQELHNWLHNKREELLYIENQPSKLYRDVGESDLERLMTFHSEIKARGPVIEELQSLYRSLTQHDPSSVDPVIKAIQDDWEEMLGQIDVLIHDREDTKIRAQNLEMCHDSMDEYLDSYMKELDRIDRSDAQALNKSFQKQRRRCRSTQTQSLGTGSDSDGDGPSPWKSPRGPKGKGETSRGSDRGGNVYPSQQSSLFRSHNANGHSLDTSRSNIKLRRHHNDSQNTRSFKKHFGANATLESESEESGYGDTLNAISFDTHVDEPSFLIESQQTHTLLTYIESDDESTASYISGEFVPVDPQNLTNSGTQTPSHMQTQTLMQKEMPCNTMTQTESSLCAKSLQTSTTSLHSVGVQTKKSNGSRIQLLKSILSEVKDIKKQQGLNDSRDETISVASDMTIGRDMLENLHQDLVHLKAVNTQENAATQTVCEQSTQTSIRLLPEESSQLEKQQGRFNSLLEQIQQHRDGNQSTVSNHVPNVDVDQRTQPLYHRIPPARVGFPWSFNNHGPVSSQPADANDQGHQTAPNNMNTSNSPVTDIHPGRQRVTQEDLNSLSQRLEHLSNYQIPYRQGPAGSQFSQYATRHIPQSNTVLLPNHSHEPGRYRVREFTRSYDDTDVSDGRYYERRQHNHRSRRNQEGVMERYHLDDALLEATRTARQLKRMSAKMKRNLWEELSRPRY